VRLKFLQSYVERGMLFATSDILIDRASARTSWHQDSRSPGARGEPAPARHSGSIRVLVVDEKGIMRDGLCALLAVMPGIEIVGSVAAGADASRAVASLHPTLIVVDIPPLPLKGPKLIAALKTQAPEAHVVVLSFHRETRLIESALQAGAAGYVLKSDRRDDLFDAYLSVAAGKRFLSPSSRARHSRATESASPPSALAEYGQRQTSHRSRTPGHSPDRCRAPHARRSPHALSLSHKDHREASRQPHAQARTCAMHPLSRHTRSRMGSRRNEYALDVSPASGRNGGRLLRDLHGGLPRRPGQSHLSPSPMCRETQCGARASIDCAGDLADAQQLADLLDTAPLAEVLPFPDTFAVAAGQVDRGPTTPSAVYSSLSPGSLRWVVCCGPLSTVSKTAARSSRLSFVLT
jgi:DNA-binding NarL/FixJ family response regulator